MLSKKIKVILFSILAVVIVLVVIALATAPSQPTNPAGSAGQNQKENEQQPTAERSGTVDNPPPPPVFQTSERVYEVISGGADFTYRVREAATQKELDLFLPSDANITAGSRESIKAGTILTVQRFIDLANGIIANDLSISTVE